jgi:hypothetical protein
MAMPKLKGKVVQTELDQSDYETLAGLARAKNLTIKEAAREALRWWTASQADLTADPLFALEPVDFKLKVRADEIEDFLYGAK